MFDIVLVPCRQDNYAFLWIERATKHSYIIDTPDAQKIADYVQQNQLIIKGILNTHIHHDHIGGNAFLYDLYECPIYGAAEDKLSIPHCSDMLLRGQSVTLWADTNPVIVDILDLSGHLPGQIGFYAASQNVAFVGDALFNLGCGRVANGAYAIMWQNLQNLCSLPDETKLYAAHEYTLQNLAFIEHFFPCTPEFSVYSKAMRQQRQQGLPTVPMTLISQKYFNPFLNVDKPFIRKILQLEDAQDIQVFTALRQLKDRF